MEQRDRLIIWHTAIYSVAIVITGFLIVAAVLHRQPLTVALIVFGVITAIIAVFTTPPDP